MTSAKPGDLDLDLQGKIALKHQNFGFIFLKI